jgi:hypothetical protein
MADRVSSIDDLLALPDMTPAPVATPMAMPTPTPTPMMTPVAMATPAAVSTPTGYMSAIGRGIGGGIQQAAQGYSGLADILTNPMTYASRVGTYVSQNPLEAALSTARAVPRMAVTGLTAAGGGIGLGALGAAGGTAVGGPVGGLVGGIGGGIAGVGAGYSAGDMAYSKFENSLVKGVNSLREALGYKPYELPNPELTGYQELEQFTKGATGGMIEEVPSRLVAGLPSAIKVVAGKVGKTAAEIKSEALPIASPKRRAEQKGLVADVFDQAGVSKEMLDQVIERKKNPLTAYDANKSTSELLDDLGYKDQAEKLAVIEAFAAESPAGQLPALKRAQIQGANAESQIASLMESPDPDKRALGQKLEAEFTASKEVAKKDYEDLYTKLYETSDKTKLTATQLPDQLRTAASKYLPEGYASDKNVIDKVVNVLEKKKSYDIRDLVGASSRLKEEARDLYAKKTSVDSRLAAAAEDASKVVDALIESDPRFGQHFAKANQARADFANKYQKGRVAQVGREFDMSPENIAAELSQNTDQWVQGMKVFGDAPEATRALITQKLDGFTKLGSIDEKIKWLDSNIDLFKSTDQVGAVRQAREGLMAAKKYMEQQKRLKNVGESLSLEGIGIGDLQRTAITSAAANLPESGKAALQSLRQVTRDKGRQAAAGMNRLISGLSSPFMSMVGAGLARTTLGRSVANVEASIGQINKTLVSALNDPEKARRLMEFAGKRGEALAAGKQKYGGMAARGKEGMAKALGAKGTTAAARAGVVQPLLGALSGTQQQKTSDQFGRNVSGIAPAAAPTPTPAPTKKIQSIDDLLAEEAPSPTKEPGALEKIASALNPISDAEAATRKPSKMPVLKTIAQKQAYLKQKAANFDIKKEIKFYSKMVQAVAQVESGTDHGKVSEAGALGAMQIMPETAKALGIDPYDPRQNLDGGEKYLDYLYKRFGKAPLAFAAYNMGEGKLSRMIKQAGSTNWSTIIKKVGIKSKRNPGGVPEETLAYVPKVMKNYLG